jgi:hypothetical protein
MTTYTIDEYLKLEKTTALECLQYYCLGIIECFGDEFLHRATVADTRRLLAKVEERGFFDMLGSINYMHWQWHNCPVGCQSQFTRGHQTSYNHPWSCFFSWPLDLSCFFGVVDSSNDINVLNQCPLFIDVIKGRTPEVSFTVNGRDNHMRYYLTNGIYPSWPVFVEGVHVPQ